MNEFKRVIKRQTLLKDVIDHNLTLCAEPLVKTTHIFQVMYIVLQHDS